MDDRNKLAEDLEATLAKIEDRARAAKNKIEARAGEARNKVEDESRKMADDAIAAVESMRESMKAFVTETAPDSIDRAWNDVKERWTLVEGACADFIRPPEDDVARRARETFAGRDELNARRNDTGTNSN